MGSGSFLEEPRLALGGGGVFGWYGGWAERVKWRVKIHVMSVLRGVAGFS